MREENAVLTENVKARKYLSKHLDSAARETQKYAMYRPEERNKHCKQHATAPIKYIGIYRYESANEKNFRLVKER
jgi:hypothetical protein